LNKFSLIELTDLLTSSKSLVAADLHGENMPLVDSPVNRTCCDWIKILCSGFCLIFLSVAAIILIGIALFGSSNTMYNIYALIADWLLMITYISLLVGICIIGCRSDENDSDNHNKSHSTICITIIWILGLGDSLFNLTRFGDQFILILTKNYYPHSSCQYYIIISMIENGLKCFSQLCILMFIMYQFRYPAKSKSGWSKFFTVCLSITCLLQWLLLLFQEIDQDERKYDSCIVNNSQGDRDSFKKVEPFLYPLGVEFRFACFIELLIISECHLTDIEELLPKCCGRLVKALSFFVWIIPIIVLVIVWIVMRIVLAIVWIFTYIVLPVIFCIKLIFSEFPCCQKTDGCTGNKCRNLLFILVPACGFSLVSCSMVIIFFQEINESYDNNVRTLISESCEIILAVIILIHTILSFGDVREQKMGIKDILNIKSLQHEFKIDFFFLLLANVFLWVYSILTLHGSVCYSPTNGLLSAIKVTTMIASVIPIIQSTLQLAVILNLSKKQAEVLKTIEVTINMWIILSFSIWLFDTFSAKEYHTNRIQEHAYGEKGWEKLRVIFIPMAIFYRFHSCIVFANMKAEVYHHKETHQEV
jgi:hypothetical protein